MSHDIDAMRAIYGELTGDYGASVATMTPALIAMRADSAQQADLCRAAAGMAKGKRRIQYTAWARQHGRNAMAIDDALNPMPADIANMGIDELYDALAADGFDGYAAT